MLLCGLVLLLQQNDSTRAPAGTSSRDFRGHLPRARRSLGVEDSAQRHGRLNEEPERRRQREQRLEEEQKRDDEERERSRSAASR